MTIKDRSLSPEALEIIRHQATEKPNPAAASIAKQPGTYLCRACGLALFRTQMQFQAYCGWPSFDAAIEDSVAERSDTDGQRTEIICARCQAHLGHVFDGEGFTAKNRRHCVNTLSLDFVENLSVFDTDEAILAAGCFWGVQHNFDQLEGVLKTEVGYTGGKTSSPRYTEVCSKATGHYEAIRVLYDKSKLDYQAVLKYFFNIHDATQTDGQGPDRGQQYQSAIFYYDDTQEKIAENVIHLLKNQGYQVATRLLPVNIFWQAEVEHQHYYLKNKINHE